MPPVNMEPGVVIGGRYRLVRILGQGGMAVVWRAEHTETGRQVALKVVRAELSRSEQMRDLFVREARIAARIGRSDHIVDVLDAGVDPQCEVPFMAMELLDGEPLDERLLRDGPVPLAESYLILQQIADALDQAHEAGVVHRDLKPQNLFLTRSRRGETCLKVLDFGIAKVAETVQQSATQVGTPAYSAPEQLGATWRTIAERNGRRVAAQVSPATDVWAYGLVAFELLTGAASGDFWGASTLAELPAKIFLEPLPTASSRAGPRAVNLPHGFDHWLARCLAMDATERWPSAGAAARALTASTQAQPSLHHPAPAPAAYAHSQDPISAHSASPPHGPTPQYSVRASSPPHPSPGTAAPHSVHTSSLPRPSHAPYNAAHAAAPPTDAIATPTNVAPNRSSNLDPALLAWARQRHVELRPSGDIRTYRAWMPFHFIPEVVRVGREGQLRIQEADVLVAEATVNDQLRQVIGEAHQLLVLVLCNRLRYRVALRSKRVTGFGDGLSKGLRALDNLVASKPRGLVLGDAAFESKFEVAAPSAEEGNAALPPSVRQLLAQQNLIAALEMRPGGLVAARDQAWLTPPHADPFLELLGQVLAAY